jgi:intein/homing endonuclease
MIEETIIESDEKTKTQKITDCSMVIKTGEEGIVHRIVDERTHGGLRIVKVIMMQHRIPEIGDKLASNTAQKGVCLTLDSNITLQSGISIKIKDIVEGDKLWGYNKEKDRLEISTCTNKVYMGKKETIKITMKTGKELICTPDHRILTLQGWKEACQLSENDFIISNLPAPLDEENEDEKGWTLHMHDINNGGEMILNMETKKERNRSLIFARILGFLISDGWLCRYTDLKRKSLRAGVSLGTQIDVNLFIQDIRLLLDNIKLKYKNHMKFDFSETASFYNSNSYAGSCFVYYFPTFLANCIGSLENITIGKNILQKPKWPTFLKTAPKSIIREFLGGLLGGDGCAPYVCRNEIMAGQFILKFLESNVNEAKEYLLELQNMLKKLNVDTTLALPIKCKSKAKDGAQRIRYGIRLKRTSEFINNIGFRYCMYKQCKLSSASSYWQMKSFLSGNLEGSSGKTKNIPTGIEWLKTIGAYEWFEKGRYCIDRYATEIPYYAIPIHSLEIHKVEDVYDISVANLHSFIANGMVVHNCGMIYSQEDMPYTTEGIVPDVILNPNAIPSRMTINQLLQTVLGKSCALSGEYGNGTPFSDNENTATIIQNKLKQSGYSGSGYETMYCGFTGQPFRAQIFIGPTYYQKLKHMVVDKIHCLSMDHEILTYEGWKSYYDLSENDLIATLADGELVYEKPIELLYYPDFKGNMYEISNANIDLRVTDNHRMWVSVNDEEFKLIQAKDIIRKDVKYQSLTDIISLENKKEKIFYSEEPVFCLQVPSEVFYVRRNGKAVWTGNSRNRGPVTSLTKQPLEGRSRAGGLKVGEMKYQQLLFKQIYFIHKNEFSNQIIKCY